MTLNRGERLLVPSRMQRGEKIVVRGRREIERAERAAVDGDNIVEP